MKGFPMDRKKVGTGLFRTGAALLLLSLLLFVVVFWPVLYEEARYAFLGADRDGTVSIAVSPQDADDDVIVPVDTGFGIIVPKIGANAPIVSPVDPSDEAAYRKALRGGIAHAEGTRFPGEPGNAFFFAHASDDFYSQSRYNTVFYLLDKLVSGDRFYVVRDGVIYEYRVFDKRTVAPEAVEYLGAVSKESTVTLMTCWPAGTAAKRLLVFGVLEAVYADGRMKISE
jgi:sortase A